MKLYYHKTSGGAEYLMDTFTTYTHRITGKKYREGKITDKTKYIVRIDGDITKDAELTIRSNAVDDSGRDGVCVACHGKNPEGCTYC